eukprot:2523710-Rhodomonas_salina.1
MNPNWSEAILQHFKFIPGVSAHLERARRAQNERRWEEAMQRFNDRIQREQEYVQADVAIRAQRAKHKRHTQELQLQRQDP